MNSWNWMVGMNCWKSSIPGAWLIASWWTPKRCSFAAELNHRLRCGRVRGLGFPGHFPKGSMILGMSSTWKMLLTFPPRDGEEHDGTCLPETEKHFHWGWAKTIQHLCFFCPFGGMNHRFSSYLGVNSRVPGGRNPYPSASREFVQKWSI